MAEVQVGGKGIEKALNYIAKGVSELQVGIENIAYGNPNKPDAGIKFPGNQFKTNGLLPIFREINAIDFCNIINYALGNINLISKETANGESEANSFEKKIIGLKDTAKKILEVLDKDYLDSSIYKDEKIKLLIESTNELANLIDSDMVTVFPDLVNVKNSIFDVIGTLTQISQAQATYETFSLIPNAELQKLLKKIRELRAILTLIAGIKTLKDITSLLIPETIKELQKILNPAALLPIIRKVSVTLKAVNQKIQKIFNVVNKARLYVKVLTILIKALKIIIKLYRLLAIPNATMVHGQTSTLIYIEGTAEKKLGDALKRIEQLLKVIEVIYFFVTDVLRITKELQNQVQILILNLESCEDLKDSAMIKELKIIHGNLVVNNLRLEALAAQYIVAQSKRNELNFNSFVFKIEEEELTEGTIKYKRRRAVAYDNQGILAYATDLTFATDTSILFEELRLLMVNNGMLANTGKVELELAFAESLLDLPESDEDMYASIGMIETDGIEPDEQMQKDQQEAKAAVNSFLSGLKGGPEFLAGVKESADERSKKLKIDINTGAVDPTAVVTTSGQPTATGYTSTAASPTATKEAEYTQTSTTNSDLLTTEEKARYQQIIKTRPTGSVEWIEAQKKLTKDRAARMKEKR
jgi:hypothetical protein